MKKIGITGNAFRLPFGSKENTGNIIHANAAKSIFKGAVELDINDSDAYIEKVRDQCSHLGFAAATMLCLNSPPWLDVLTKVADFIEKLDLPVVAFGIGNSTEKKEVSLSDAKVDPRSIRLLKVLADHAETVAVRGEFTAELCRQAGVTNIDVVGCQSIYYSASLNPPSAWTHRETTRRTASSTTNTIDLTEILVFCINNKVDLIGQDELFEHAISLGHISMQQITGEPPAAEIPMSFFRSINKDIIPPEKYHAYVSQHFHKFFDIESWTSHIAKNYDFAFGTRFHGNVAALQAGVPALWLTHDIRTIELCRHFGLPNIAADDFGNYQNLQDLKEATDFSLFKAKLPARLDEFLAYLEKNGATPYISDDFVDGIAPWRNYLP